MIRLEYDKMPVFRSPENLEMLRERPCLYGLPLILPANRTDGGRFIFGDRCYNLPINEPHWNNHIHGLLKDAPFTVLSAEPASLHARLVNSGEYYPFPFVLEITDSLSPEGFLRTLTLKNTGAVPMPYTVGFHATFAEPESFAVPVGKCCEMDARALPTGKLLELSERQLAYKSGFRPDGSPIRGIYTSDGGKVQLGRFTMEVSKQFDHWVLFNGSGGEGYLCIEPQCGAVNGLNNDKHRVLQPGDEEKFYLHIK
jgi:aldose 1-epimerase